MSRGVVRIIPPMTQAQVEKWRDVRRHGVDKEFQKDLYNFDVYEEHEARYISHGGNMWPEWDEPNNNPMDWWED